MAKNKIELPDMGPELDVMVAEKVLGLEVSFRSHDKGKSWLDGYFVKAPGWPRVERYSAVVSSAWDVVEKVEHDFIFCKHFRIKGLRYSVKIYHDGPKSGLTERAKSYEGRSSNPAHAICIAALKSVAAEGE